MKPIGPAKEVGKQVLDKSKIPPELQFHVAASFIKHGDPFSLNPLEREDKSGEICQFCIPIPPKFVGRLKRPHIDQVFENLKNSVLQKLRAAGVMDHGE